MRLYMPASRRHANRAKGPRLLRTLSAPCDNVTKEAIGSLSFMWHYANGHPRALQKFKIQ
jgi:hypothetical protein|tara:strand:- start:241 stop:420 length:180 start_codon:yes stop_codon:yes gene_type:complete